MSDYISLHTHSHFSLMDGVATPQEYADRAKDLGMKAVAITDHGTLSGHREWVRAMRAEGIKPILGIEAYYCRDIHDKRSKKDRDDPLDPIYNHLVINAKNDAGLANLGKLSQISWNEGFYNKPRMDFDMLDKYGEGLIISSACPSGILNKAIEHDNYAVAKDNIKKFSDRFGSDFYVEVMPHNDPGVNKELLDLADEFGIKAIVTPDCHHSHAGQKTIQELMLLLNTKSKRLPGVTFEGTEDFDTALEKFDYLYGRDRMSFSQFNIHLLSSEEMHDAMKADGIDREDIYSNTLDIADQVEEYYIGENLNLLPVSYSNPEEKLENLASKGLESRGIDTEEYRDRLKTELTVINSKGFAPYFFVVRNMLNWAKKNDILVGPGRGSSAGSLVCYALGITDIDPIKYGLLFERFLDESRTDWPDIDSDIMDSRREEVKDYLERQYRHVASIATYNTFKDKGVVRDVARGFNVPLDDVNKVLKELDTWDEFRYGADAAWFRQKYPDVAVYGEQLIGRVRSTGVHPAGVVASKLPLDKVSPIETRAVPNGGGKRMPVVAVDMGEAETIGLIKIDALGLKTLSVIDDTVKSIKSRLGEDIVLQDIPLDDRKVYDMLSKGNTQAVFQAEAAPSTSLLMEMGVSNFNELAASNALVRPGAMNSIGEEFLKRKNGESIVTYAHPIMKEFTEETYGEVVYQEQVMLTCTKLAGMSGSDANKIRKIIGKKKDVSALDEYKQRFISGASEHIDSEKAEKLWHDFEAHANYSFNKSHSIAYSTVTYWTAWLKCYYPLDFMFCALKHQQDTDMRTDYLIDIKRMGISVLLPHINKSDSVEKIEGDSIRLGLSSVKYISDKGAAKYIAERPFTSYEHVVEFTNRKKSGVNKKALEYLNRVGAASFSDNPPDTEEIKSNLYEVLGLPEFSDKVPAQWRRKMTRMADYNKQVPCIVMGMVRGIKRGPGWTRIEMIDRSGSVGAFINPGTDIEAGQSYIVAIANSSVMAWAKSDERNSDNPLLKYLNYTKMPLASGEYYTIAFNSRVTKKNTKMATMLLANEDGDLAPVVVWAKEYGDAYVKVEPGSINRLVLGQSRTSGDITYKGILKTKKGK